MSMTPASSEYFEKVAGGWDEISSGYFTVAVREAAIRKAYLRPEMAVADVGAGTGFMTAGLLPLVKRVYVLDGSAAMLETARKNLEPLQTDSGAKLSFQEADGLSLPLPELSLDAVFANMYLHHCTDPAASIREMVRVLRPGGRLVITDMDSHPYEWLKEEMADVWQGFDRQQIRTWFKEAGLVNVIVDCTGESCSAESSSASTPESERHAKISVFVATGSRGVSGVAEAVQAGYGAAAQGKASPESSCGCTVTDSGPAAGDQPANSSCCGGETITLDDDLDVTFDPIYSAEERSQAPKEAAEISLGCGNPVAMASLKAGEVVLDIGSGGGMDAFLAAQRVGPTGHVIGVDMTPAMLERARRTAERSGLQERVEFREGRAEVLPVEDGQVDVIISNCVINLCEDKGQVFDEAYRVLRAGGRLEVSDMVTDTPFPMEIKENPAAWPGCVYSALPEQEYLDLVKQAGFKNITTRRSSSSGVAFGVKVYSLEVSAYK